MATLTYNCPTCGKPAKIQSQFPAHNNIFYVYQCGHVELRSETLEQTTPEQVSKVVESILIPELEEEIEVQRMLSEEHFLYAPIAPRFDKSFWAIEECKPFFCNECNEFHNKKHAYEYQRQGVEFAEKALPVYSGCLFADEMGLGKTVQFLCLLKRHWAQLTPCAIIVKGSTILQWQAFIHEWVSDKLSDCIPVTDRIHLIPGFKLYIISMDLLGAKGIKDKIGALGIKCLCLDEVQNFKDNDSLRTRSLVKIIKENDIKYKVALSGTPIKNRLTEYYPILNILDPRTFYSYMGFCRTFLYKDDRGQYTRLDPSMVGQFERITSRYILRREKKDVLKDLPALTRDVQYIKIDDPIIKNAYNNEVSLLKNFLDTAERVDSTSLLGWFARMRAITGQAKVSYAVDWSQDFLDSTDHSLAIGIHHKSVRDILHLVFDKRGFSPLKLSGEDDVYSKNRIQQAFNGGFNRLLILNMLAGGVGLNLQSCSNTLVLELPWNPADMEQFIGRFHRNGQVNPVTATYVIAEGTIDEFMFDLLYEKSEISSEAGIGIAPFTDPEHFNSLTKLREFAEFIANHKI